jgi:F-type H+-transporting ATPase subunit a
MRARLIAITVLLTLLCLPVAAFAKETWSYYNIIGNAIHLPVHVVTYSVVAILLVILGSIVGMSYRKKLAAFETWQNEPMETRGTSPIDPSPKFSLANFFEGVLGAVMNLLDEMIGHGSKQYLPIIGSLAFVILFSNCLGLIPSSAIPTSNLNTNAAMALTVFLLYNYYGMKAHGVGKYLAHFMGPLEGKIKYFMAPLMIPIELISHTVRPASLTLRLFGNMYGDHTLFAVFMGMAVFPIIFPLPFYFLGLLVSVVQTLVFVMLSTVYISLAVAKDH